MFVRLLAAIWLLATLGSLSIGIRALASTSGDGVADGLEAFMDATAKVGKWQLRPATLLVVAAMQSFLAENINTSLWPWATAAWVAMLMELLFIRPHVGGYLEIVQRGFDRPVRQFMIVHIVADIVAIGVLAALVVDGVR